MAGAVKGEWRCVGCGDGKQLYACAEAIVFGRIDGPESVTEDHSEQVGLCGGSIECRVHQQTEELERWDGRRWVRFVECDRCEGRGAETNPRAVFGDRIRCSGCGGLGGRWPGLTHNPFGAH
jgi:hypothetical protein